MNSVVKFAAAMSCFCSLSSAYAQLLKPMSVSDFVAPVVASEASLSDKPVGLIFMDLSGPALKVIDSTGAGRVLYAEGTSGVTSTSADQRIARATIQCSNTASSESADWIASIANGVTTGQCSLNITGAFSGTPTCTVSMNSGVSTNAVNTGVYFNSMSNTSLSITRYYSAGTQNGAVDIICMGDAP